MLKKQKPLFARTQLRRILVLIFSFLYILGLIFSYFYNVPKEAQAASDTTYYWNDDEFRTWSYRAVDCLTTDDCKFVYDGNSDGGSGYIKFKDCDDSLCSIGSTTILDGPGCVITNCNPSFDTDNPPSF